MGTLRAASLVVMLFGCSGSAFEQGSPAGPDLGGAAGAAGASSIGTGGSSMPSGAAGSGGKAAPVAGSGGAGGELEPAASGAGGELGDGGTGSAPMLVKCSRATWTATAWATFVDTYGGPPALAFDGDDATRWSGGEAQEAGQWFEVAGLQPGVTTLELRSTQFPNDVPAKVGLMIDGAAAATTQATSGEGVLRLTAPGLEQATTVRLVLVEAPASATWWSIGELVGWCSR